MPLYYVVTWLRNKLYDLGWKSSTSYDIPVICVGNLSVGGTGKTPTIEYLIKLLSPNYKIATLSRGYKRASSGFIIANEHTSVSEIGDEPFQFFKKFKDVVVAVDADRRHGITQLIKQKQPDIILLDDAYQHRKVKAGFSILLTSFEQLYVDDFVLPTGNLREPRTGAKRANLIIVTKCPKTISSSEKTSISKKLNPLPNQQILFSSIDYSDQIINAIESLDLAELKKEEFTLVTGIANPKPLIDFLKVKDLVFDHMRYKDHHNFTKDDITMLKSKKRIVTTEKDYVRLLPHFKEEKHLYYLPIEFKIEPKELFENVINNYLKSEIILKA